MKSSPTKRHITLRVTQDEMLELIQLRQALEQSERKPVTLQAALRVAITRGHQARKRPDFARAGEDRDERLDLVVDETVSQQLDELQQQHPDESHSSIVLACGRITRGQIDAELGVQLARRKSDRPRP